MALPTNCVGYWKFNESSGNATDLVASYVLTNTTSCTYAAGQLNNAATTINTGNHKFVGSDFCDLNAGAFTIAFWLNTSNATNFRGLMSKGNDASEAGGLGWSMRNTSAGYCTFTRVFTGAVILSSDVAVNNGAWHHIVMTRSSGGDMKIYIDGTEDVSARVNNTSNWANSYNFCVGPNASDLNNVINGSFDNLLVIVGTEWSQTDVNNDYNSGTGLEYSAATNYTATPAALALTTSTAAPTDIIIHAATFQLVSITMPSTYIQKTEPLGTVTVGTGTIGTRFIKTRYPHVRGLVAGTTLQNLKPSL